MWSWSRQTPGLSRSPLPTLASPISPLWSLVGMSGTRLMSFMFAASPLTPMRIWLTWAPRPRNVSDLTKSQCDKSYCLTKGSLFHVLCFHMFWYKKRPNSIIIHPLTRLIVPNRTNSFNLSDFYQIVTASWKWIKSILWRIISTITYSIWMIIVTILRRSCLSDLVSRPINQSDGPGVPFQNVKTINKTLQERQIFHGISFWNNMWREPVMPFWAIIVSHNS